MREARTVRDELRTKEALSAPVLKLQEEEGGAASTSQLGMEESEERIAVQAGTTVPEFNSFSTAPRGLLPSLIDVGKQDADQETTLTERQEVVKGVSTGKRKMTTLTIDPNDHNEWDLPDIPYSSAINNLPPIPIHEVMATTPRPWTITVHVGQHRLTLNFKSYPSHDEFIEAMMMELWNVSPKEAEVCQQIVAGKHRIPNRGSVKLQFMVIPTEVFEVCFSSLLEPYH